MVRRARAGLVILFVFAISAPGVLSARAAGCDVGEDCTGVTGAPTQTFVGTFEFSDGWVQVEAYGGVVVTADPADPTRAKRFDGIVDMTLACSTCAGQHHYRGPGHGTYLPLDPNKLRLYGQAGDMTFDVDFHGYGSYALGPSECGEYGCPGVNPFYPGLLERPASGNGTFSDSVLGVSRSVTDASARQLLHP